MHTLLVWQLVVYMSTEKVELLIAMFKTPGLPYCSFDRLCFPTSFVHFRRGKSLLLAYSGSRPENVMVSQRLFFVTPICA